MRADAVRGAEEADGSGEITGAAAAHSEVQRLRFATLDLLQLVALLLLQGPNVPTQRLRVSLAEPLAWIAPATGCQPDRPNHRPQVNARHLPLRTDVVPREIMRQRVESGSWSIIWSEVLPADPFRRRCRTPLQGRLGMAEVRPMTQAQ